VISYRTDLAGLGADDFRGFFGGWPMAPSPAALLRILTNSTHVVPGPAAAGPAG
jgi:hypothetical protein